MALLGQKNRRDSFFKLFVEKYILRWSMYFRKKIGAIQIARQTIKFFKKKNAWALSKHGDAALICT